MAEVMDNNTESLLTSLITSSHPSLNSETTIESFVNTKETPNSRKRPSPDSPQDLVELSRAFSYFFSGGLDYPTINVGACSGIKSHVSRQTTAKYQYTATRNIIPSSTAFTQCDNTNYQPIKKMFITEL
jgi:hypothetical protein